MRGKSLFLGAIQKVDPAQEPNQALPSRAAIVGWLLRWYEADREGRGTPYLLQQALLLLLFGTDVSLAEPALDVSGSLRTHQCPPFILKKVKFGGTGQI